MFKRLLALALVLVLSLSVFVGCGNNGGDETTASNQGTPDQAGGLLFEEPFNIECVTYAVTDAKRNDSEAVKAIRTATNVYLSYKELDEFNSQYTGRLLNGDVPDLTYFGSNEIVPEYGPKGQFVDLYQHLDKMPDVKAFMEKYPESFKNYLIEDEQGENHMYALPASTMGSLAPYQYIYRKDIFEKHNLTWPNSQEEFVEVLRKLKDLYPHSYPFCIRTLETTGLRTWASHWGVQITQPTSTKTYVSIDRETGEWYHAESSAIMRECVTFINQLINEGLMLRTSLTLNTDGWETAFASEQSFVTFDKLDRLTVMNGVVKEVDPTWELTGGQTFAMGANGTALVSGSSDSVGSTNYSFAVGKDADIEKMCKFLNWMYSDYGIEVTNWGLRDVHHTVNAEGKKEFTPEMYELAEAAITGVKYATCFGYRGITALTLFDATIATYDTNIRESFERAVELYGRKGQRTLNQYNEAEKLIIEEYGLALKNYSQATLAKFMAGELPINDSEWNKFVSECQTRGVNQLIAAHKTAYDRQWGPVDAAAAK